MKLDFTTYSHSWVGENNAKLEVVVENKINLGLTELYNMETLKNLARTYEPFKEFRFSFQFFLVTVNRES